jgi:hypothetical protein
MRKNQTLPFAVALALATPILARAGAASAGIMDFFYITAGVGFETVDLQTIRLGDSNLTAEVLPTSVSGVAPQLAAGLRFLFLSAGVRASVALFNDESSMRAVHNMQLWNIDGEFALRGGIGPFTPYAMIALGYSKLGGVGDAIRGVHNGFDVDGANFQLAGGLDFSVTPSIAFGVRLTGGLLYLNRSGVAARDLAMARAAGVSESATRVLEVNGTSLGTMVNLSALATYSF